VIVIVCNDIQLSSAEAELRRVLESWQAGSTQVGGIAVLSCNVRGSREFVSHELDALVWTPHGCTVIEVKGFRSVQHGVVHPRLNGDWRVGEAVADLYKLGSSTNPVAQAKPYMYAVKNRFRAAGLPDWVQILVVLVPQPRAHLTITSSKLDHGIHLVEASSRTDLSLRRFFTPGPGSRRLWSGEDIEHAFYALELDDYLPERSQLTAQGFYFGSPVPIVETRAGEGAQELASPRAMPCPPTLITPRSSPSVSRDDLASQRRDHAHLGHRSPVPADTGEDIRDSGRRATSGQSATSSPLESAASNRGQRPALSHAVHARRPDGERYLPVTAASPPPLPETALRRWPRWVENETLHSILAIIVLAAVLVALVTRCGGTAEPAHSGEPGIVPSEQARPSSPARTAPGPSSSTPEPCMPFQPNCVRHDAPTPLSKRAERPRSSGAET
jgi:hypothetical protein